MISRCHQTTLEGRSGCSRLEGTQPAILVGVVGNISACHADARGSIPRRGAFWRWRVRSPWVHRCAVSTGKHPEGLGRLDPAGVIPSRPFG